MTDDGTGELVRRAVGREPAAVHALVCAIGPVVQGRVAKALYRRRGPSARGRDVTQEIDDLAQEVFLALFENDARALRAWDPTRGPLGGYVALLADHLVASVFRSGRRRPWSDELDVLPEPDAVDEAHGPERLFGSIEMLDVLLERLRAELSPKGFDVFVRLYVEEQSVESVAAALAMTPDALYAWRSRLSKLVRSLAAEVGGESMSNSGPERRISHREAS
ncbi:MAG: sigma-70 family RNA polymerase sigma factor [Myxococcales bacterium]|nr:sigma-70 family RNA polymerase sigma factor [Myxococcales bacterium]